MNVVGVLCITLGLALGVMTIVYTRQRYAYRKLINLYAVRDEEVVVLLGQLLQVKEHAPDIYEKLANNSGKYLH